jgi:hypothetical protein
MNTILKGRNMTDIQQFADAYDMNEQLQSFPGEYYHGDSTAWDAWSREGTEVPAQEQALLLHIIRQETGVPAGYDYYAITTMSGSVDLYLLLMPSGDLVVHDSQGWWKRYTAAQLAAMPHIVYSEVTQEGEDE